MRSPRAAAGPGPGPMPGAGGAAGGQRRSELAPLRAGSAFRLLPLTRKEESEGEALLSPCESRAAPAEKGETDRAGAAGRGRVLLHCCPAGEEAEETSAKRGHGRAVF